MGGSAPEIASRFDRENFYGSHDGLIAMHETGNRQLHGLWSLWSLGRVMMRMDEGLFRDGIA